jgi:hypothetical protein
MLGEGEAYMRLAWGVSNTVTSCALSVFEEADPQVGRPPLVAAVVSHLHCKSPTL